MEEEKIDFLSSQDKEKKSKPKEDKEIALEWSEPAETNKQGKKSKTGWFFLFSKKPKKEEKSKLAGKQLKKSREEVWRLIKQQQAGQKSSQARAEKFGLVSWLKNKFKKTDEAEPLLDFQQQLSKEKEQPRPEEWSKLQAEKVGETKPEGEVQTEEELTDQKEILSTKIKKKLEDFVSKLKAEELKEMEPASASPSEQPASIKPAKMSKSQPTVEKKPITKMVKANLIKGEIISFFEWRKKIIVLINAIIFPCLVIAVLYGALILYQKYQEEKNKVLVEEYQQLSSKIREAEKQVDEILAFQKKLIIVQAMLGQHIYWTNFFKFLEDNTIANAYYIDFAGDVQGSYELNTIATKYSDMAEQINVFKKNTQVIEVKTKGGGLVASNVTGGQTGGVQFSITLTIDKQVFTPAE